MKRLFLLPILLLAGCANLSNVQTYLGTPQQVQSEVSVLAALAKPYVPASDAALVHQFAATLATSTTATAPVPPSTTHPKTQALISAASAIVSLAIARVSSASALEYIHAVGNGLLISFP